MLIELRWLVSTTAGALYAAGALSAGSELVDRKLEGAIRGTTDELLGELAAAGIQPALFFSQAIPLAPRFDSPVALSDAVLARVVGPGGTNVARQAFVRRLAALERALGDAYPNALAELELRGVPLGEQWDARGPGLLAALVRATEPELLVESADVVLVLPALGGGGMAHPPCNAVTFEAVLANPVPELPEIVRLAWLLSQLTFDMPRFEDRLARDHVARIGPLAMILPVLAAAEEVELTRLSVATIEVALRSWNVGCVDAATLLDWWETYQATRPTWIAAVGALAEMLSSEPGGSQATQV